MHESTEELASLQQLLDASYSTAGEHLLAIHQAEWRMPAESVSSALRGVCVLNLATVSATGAPVVAPVDGLFLGGHFWFGSANNSRRFQHLRRDPRVSAAYTLGEEISVVVHGLAHEIDTSTGDFERLHDYCREVYGDAYDSFGFWGNAPFAWVEPQRMYAIRIQANKEET